MSDQKWVEPAILRLSSSFLEVLGGVGGADGKAVEEV